MKEHGWSLDELESMLPWEREIYVGLVSQRVKEENARLKAEEQKLQGMSRGKR